MSLAHSLFVISLNIYRKAYQKQDERWLLLLLVALFWLQLEFLTIRWPYDLGVNIFYGTRHGTWLLVGPVFYFYISAITKRPLGRLYQWSFLPFFLFTIAIPLFGEDFLTFRQVHYGMLTPFDSWPDEITWWQYLYSGVFIFQFAYCAYFLALSLSSVGEYRTALKQTNSEIPRSDLRWLAFLSVGMILLLVTVSGFLYLLFYTEIYRRQMDYFYILPMSMLVYGVSYRLFGVSLEKPQEISKYQKSGLRANEASSLVVKLERILKEDKLYLKKGLKLKDAADELDISPHQLSEVINGYMHTSFFDLINGYRVKEAKELIQTNHQFTLLHIGLTAGFNNKTSFVNAFKRFEGVTPSQYAKAYK